MIVLLLCAVSGAAAIAAWEAAKRRGLQLIKRQLPPAVVTGLTVIDQVLPVLVQEGATSQQLKDRVVREVQGLAESEWRQIRQEFDPGVFLDKLLTSTL